MSDLIKIGSLWSNTDKKGQKFLAGYLGDARLLIMKNGFKEEEKQPDYVVYVTKKEVKQDGTTNDPEESIPF